MCIRDSFYTTEKVKNNLNPGDPVVLNKDGVDYDGTITEVSNMADAGVGLFKVKASVEDNNTMTPGTDVELQVPKDSALNVMSVSYTHLDVYKRQEHPRPHASGQGGGV